MDYEQMKAELQEYQRNLDAEHRLGTKILCFVIGALFGIALMAATLAVIHLMSR